MHLGYPNAHQHLLALSALSLSLVLPQPNNFLVAMLTIYWFCVRVTQVHFQRITWSEWFSTLRTPFVSGSMLTINVNLEGVYSIRPELALGALIFFLFFLIPMHLFEVSVQLSLSVEVGETTAVESAPNSDVWVTTLNVSMQHIGTKTHSFAVNALDIFPD